MPMTDHSGLGAAYLRSHPQTPIAHDSAAACGYCEQVATPPTPVPDRPEPLTASLELLAAALCHDAQVEGYDHAANPTLVSMAPAYCPRHLGIAQSVRYSLSRDYVRPAPTPEAAGLREALEYARDGFERLAEMVGSGLDSWGIHGEINHQLARTRATIANSVEVSGELAAGLREALTAIVHVLGPEAPEHDDVCEGCQHEIGEAIDIARSALATVSSQPDRGLGGAWEEAEAALPEQAVIDSITRRSDYVIRQITPGAKVDEDRRWVVKTALRNSGFGYGDLSDGPTPAAALHALAARLRNTAR